jgi:hypothetical protein
VSDKKTKKMRKVYKKMYAKDIEQITTWPLRYRLKVIWTILKGSWKFL